MVTKVRLPAVAGLFYPNDRTELSQMLKDLLGKAQGPNVAPKALIAPHAGYIYSGPIAASVYAQVASARQRIRRVILLGPAHRVPFHGIAASSASAFDTPLGPVPVDTAAVQALLSLPQVRVLDEAHDLEHSLEVHLPFLQTVLDQFSLVPLVVGDASYQDVADVIEFLWGGDETLIVISSDLSHYHDYDTARTMDRATSKAIEALEPELIDHDQACGRTPVGGLLLVARQHGLHARTLDLRNSGDTAGPRDQVVGYGAYAIV
jgi:hypothetical protein